MSNDQEPIPCINCICFAICKAKYNNSSYFIFNLFEKCDILKQYLTRNNTYTTTYKYDTGGETIIPTYDPIRMTKLRDHFNIYPSKNKGVI